MPPSPPSPFQEPTRTRQSLTTAGDFSVTVLQVLREISCFVPIPLLGLAADTAIKIIQTIQDCKQNKEKLLELANDVYNLLLTIHEVCNITTEHTVQATDTTSVQPFDIIMDAFSPEIQYMLKMMNRTLDQVQTFIEECQKNTSFLVRLVHYKSIADGIDHYRAEIEKILTLVQFRSNLIMHRKIDKLVGRTVERCSQSTEPLPRLTLTPDESIPGTSQIPELSRRPPAPVFNPVPQFTLGGDFRANVHGKTSSDSVYGVQDVASSQRDKDEGNQQLPPCRDTPQTERLQRYPTVNEDHFHPRRRYDHHVPDRESFPRSGFNSVNHYTNDRSRSSSPFYDRQPHEDGAYPNSDVAHNIPGPSYSPWSPANKVFHHPYYGRNSKTHTPRSSWGVFPDVVPVNHVLGNQVTHTNYGGNNTFINCGNSYSVTNYNNYRIYPRGNDG
ncbi:hypothetical protein Moror_14576 [Moniliophthora roreri MCA 2997]|uniref:Uncharacterized protein n=2 Tax=Moniliophthora roreri TaxID=221103 RepID=V2YNJ0_MONRO|nr:hypothetical protein Moror_14576 [Moniliophthora roreri MCA 2997]